MEAQIEESSSARHAGTHPAITPKQLQNQIKQADLRLSRSRVVQQLEHSTNPRYTELMRRTLAGLDMQIAALSN